MILLVAVGNPMRGDDGVAHRLLDLVAPLPQAARACRVHQLTPEVAARLADAERVLIVDAAVDTPRPVLEIVVAARANGPFAHVVLPGEVIALARRLFGFTGGAWSLRLPAADFTAGDNLSADAASALPAAAALLRDWLTGE